MFKPARLPLLATILLTATLFGCASEEPAQNGPLPPGSQEARVDVRNNNWLDMAVYAERGSMRIRIGTVTSMGKEMLTIPRNMLASATSIRLIAAPIGSTENYATYPVDVWPGDVVEFTIENNMGISNVSTW